MRIEQAPIRVKSRVGFVEDGPPELINKYTFEVHIIHNGGADDGKLVGPVLGPFGPFDTEDQAKAASEVEIRRALRDVGYSHVQHMNVEGAPMEDLNAERN